jgi:hypothetical protein
VATRPFEAGECIVELEGVLTARPSRYTVQLAEDLHLAPPPGLDPADTTRAAWRFLNHACEPNARLDGRQLMAWRPIAAGEEITFDYETTELDMAEPFACACPACGGRPVRGFRHLDAAEQARRAPLLAEYLRARLAPCPHPAGPGAGVPPPRSG